MAIIIAVVVALSVVKVGVANRLVDASEKLRTLDKAISTIEDKNQVLSENLRARMAITIIDREAKALGFAKSEALVFLSSSVNMAMR